MPQLGHPEAFSSLNNPNSLSLRRGAPSLCPTWWPPLVSLPQVLPGIWEHVLMAHVLGEAPRARAPLPHHLQSVCRIPCLAALSHLASPLGSPTALQLHGGLGPAFALWPTALPVSSGGICTAHAALGATRK